ncbi:MAG TPA: ACT domain-containing protein [Pseudoflavonifractor sp.]|jgi:ACT domain-containing protein|nr:ACT domain-containing protein [Pseudoflavonifractor sp.]
MRAIVTVNGKDQVGIIATVCTLLTLHNVNVLDISQTILQGYFTMTMLVDASAADIPFSDLVVALEEAGTKLGLSIRAQREDLFIAMHRI